MKTIKKILFAFPFLFTYLVSAQDSAVYDSAELNELVLKEKNGKARVEANQPARFIKGNKVFQELVYQNFRMRKIKSTEKQETCELTFVIEKDGLLVDIKAAGNNESFNREAIQSVTKINEKWIPAEMNGERVRYRFRLPLTIKFDEK